MTEPVQAIGGYFELESCGKGEGELYPLAHRFQSARAAIMALALRCRPKRLWLPFYICAEMSESLISVGIELCRYRIDQNFRIIRDFCLGREDWLLCVNYFGVADAVVDEVLNSFPYEQVLVDQAQAFFSPPRYALATVYSPRKFFGVPDGGYLLTETPVPEPLEQDEGSAERCEPLRIRRLEGAEAGYGSYRATEAALKGQPPRVMSDLTRGLLAGIDYFAARTRRIKNFRYLHEYLGKRNRLRLSVAEDVAPLCYPYLPDDGTTLRERLLARRVYAPVYWPGFVQQSDPLAAELAAGLLPLPIDQRYGEKEMETILELLCK